MRKFSLSVCDFAVPTPRTGSIEANSGYGDALDEGAEIHRRVQELRARDCSEYQAELKISHEFERGGYRFLVSGRMDGFFNQDPPKIEEIKSSFNIWELIRKLSDWTTDHPYLLQLRTYGYFYWLKNQRQPELSFHLVSTRSNETEDFGIDLGLRKYESWLDRRLDELVIQADRAEKRLERRKKLGEKLVFPFDSPRPGQVDLINTIEEGMAHQSRMLIQAPTGLGKTAAVFYPVLKEALGRGQKLIYVTPKNSQHEVAEDAVERFQQTGAKVKSLTITAKSKICFKNEPICNPEFCEYAREHYTKVHENQLMEVLAKKKKLKARVFRELGEEYQVCPFELQMEAAREADAVICDYNYVFSPRSALNRGSELALENAGSPNLVVDEAHNLASRAMDYYSPALSTAVLEKMGEAIADLPKKFRAEMHDLLEECIRVVLSCKPKGEARAAQIEPPIESFHEQDAKLRAFLSRYLESDVEIQPRDLVLRLCFYWGEFASALEFVGEKKRPEFFTTFHARSDGAGTVKITCCDASEMLKLCYDGYEQVVGFSATLKPFEYYAKLSGLDPQSIKTAEFQSPFQKENRKLLIIPQVSTKYSDRERNYPRIAEAIAKIASLRPGNYFAFFPSFDFLERVLAVFRPTEAFTVLKQEREMKASQIEEILAHLRLQTQPTIVFAVQGGVFAEGVDYPGDTVIGAFVVGPPLPSFDLEREEMKKYYQENYGTGFEYAYAYPAMAKAVQAAGRVIRSETDRGLIVLMDQRFVQPDYAKSMPKDWFNESPLELVSGSILKEVSEFWSQATVREYT